MSNTLSTRIKMAAGRTAVATMVGAAALTGAIAVAPTAGAELYGDPDAAAEYWQPQHYDNCSLMAVADVVGQLTGDLPTEREIMKLASETPSQAHPGSIYIKPADITDPNTGMGTAPIDIAVLLQQYGIESVITDEQLEDERGGIPTGMDALASYLEEGHKVIVGVNGEMLWGVPGDRTYANHAVVVTGIDTTEGVVHINDSGNPNGRNDQVPIETFVESWATSDNMMIVTVETS